MQTIVLIPGYMCDGTIWKSLKTKLENKKYNVIIPELKLGKTIKEFTQHTLKLLPEKFIVVGFSMGGFVALNLAIYYPKKVQKLILIGSNGRSVSKSRKTLLTKSLNEFNKNNYIEKLSINSLNSYFLKKNKNNKRYTKIMNLMAENLGYKCFKNQTNAIIERPNLLRKLQKLNMKTLIISGSQDKMSSREMNIELKNQIKNSDLSFIPYSSHFVMFEQSERFNKAIISWLKKSNNI